VLRKEIKYAVPLLMFARIRQKLDAVMTPDANGGYGGYRVRSLYFDSVYDTCLTDNLDGLLKKSKIRLRLYRHDDARIKLEHKRKYGSDGDKAALSVDRAQARAMMICDYGFLGAWEEPLAREMYLRLTQGAYRPVSIVEYSRIAYAYPASEARVTFDTDIRASCVPNAFLDEFPPLYPIVAPDYGVLEVKYNDFFPGVFRDIVSYCDNLQVANSKYAQSRLDLL
jgi:hypothetical protein